MSTSASPAIARCPAGRSSQSWSNMVCEVVGWPRPSKTGTPTRKKRRNWASGSTGSAYADLLTGLAGQYNEQNFNPLHNEAYHSIEFFAQDSWKASKRLTIELALAQNEAGHPQQALSMLGKIEQPPDQRLAAQYHAVKAFAQTRLKQSASPSRTVEPPVS